VQGSGIGPIAFIIYIDHLVILIEQSGIHVKVSADDMKVYINLIPFIRNKCRDKEHKKKRKKYKKTGYTLMHLQSMTLKMFVNSINNRQATITCITKT